MNATPLPLRHFAASDRAQAEAWQREMFPALAEGLEHALTGFATFPSYFKIDPQGQRAKSSAWPV